MNIREKQRKAKAGVLLIASPRFRQLGKGLSRGTYQERQEKVVTLFLDRLCEQMEVTFPGVVYERADDGQYVEHTAELTLSDQSVIQQDAQSQNPSSGQKQRQQGR